MHCLMYFKLCLVNVQCLLRVFVSTKNQATTTIFHVCVMCGCIYMWVNTFFNVLRTLCGQNLVFVFCLHVSGISSVSEHFHKNISNFVWAQLHFSCCFYFCHQEHLELSFSATYEFVQKLCFRMFFDLFFNIFHNFLMTLKHFSHFTFKLLQEFLRFWSCMSFHVLKCVSFSVLEHVQQNFIACTNFVHAFGRKYLWNFCHHKITGQKFSTWTRNVTRNSITQYPC